MEISVMNKIVSAATVLALAAGANAAPFLVISHQSGGAVPGISGPGIYVSHQGFFDVDGSGPSPGSASGFTAAGGNEWDSYLALDPIGPSIKNRASGAQVPNNSTTTFNFYGGEAGGYPAPHNLTGDYNAQQGIYGPGSHIGDPLLSGTYDVLEVGYGLGSNPPHTHSGFAPLVGGGGRSNLDGVFVARLTIPADAVLSGGVRLNIRVMEGSPVFETGDLLFSGQDDVPGPAVTIAGQQFALTAFLIATHEAGTLSGFSDELAGDDFGAARTVDLWAHVIPTPGTLALLGLGGLAAARRRRA